MTAIQPRSGVIYSEKVRPTLGMWALITGAALSTALMVLPIWALGAVILPIVSFVFFAWWLRSMTYTIVVTEAQFLIGDAHIDRKYVSEAIGYDAEDSRTARGTGLDARAFLYLRPWVKTNVKVTIDDVADPTPYWLVASRRPMELAAALNG